MDESENQKILAEYSKTFPPIISLQQAATIAQKPLGTLYDWSSQGFFDGFKSTPGRGVRLQRDSFVRWLLIQDPRDDLDQNHGRQKRRPSR